MAIRANIESELLYRRVENPGVPSPDAVDAGFVGLVLKVPPPPPNVPPPPPKVPPLGAPPPKLRPTIAPLVFGLTEVESVKGFSVAGILGAESAAAAPVGR